MFFFYHNSENGYYILTEESIVFSGIFLSLTIFPSEFTKFLTLKAFKISWKCYQF